MDGTAPEEDREGRPTDLPPPAEPTFVNATFPDYHTAKDYCQSHFTRGLCGISDMVAYARSG